MDKGIDELKQKEWRRRDFLRSRRRSPGRGFFLLPLGRIFKIGRGTNFARPVFSYDGEVARIYDLRFASSSPF